MLDKVKSLFQREALEDQIPLVIIKLEKALSGLDQISASLKEEDNELFEQCIAARMKNDTVHAMMYANECAMIRNIALHVVSSKYALEQMVLRLHTVTKLGNILVTMAPVISVIKETGNRLVGIVPNVSNNLNDANRILVRCLTKMGTSAATDVPPVICNEEALKVLEEANTAAEKTIREKFPKIPQSLELKEIHRAELQLT